MDIEKEKKLILDAQKDAELFEPLYDKYYLSIFYYVAKRTEDKDLAGEITAVVFLKALENIRKYNFQGLPFSSWLYRIAQNTLTDTYRQNKLLRIVDCTTQRLESIADEVEPEDTEERIETVMNLIPALSESEISLIEMRYFEQRKMKEISEILNISEENVRVKLHRLIAKMKGMMNLNLKK